MKVLRMLAVAAMAVGAIMVGLAGPASAKGKTHYLAIHVDEGDPSKMNLALNNVQNVRKYYDSQGDKAVIEVVAYGPGLKMYMANSPVKSRIETMALAMDNLQFSACANTHRKMSKKAGKEIALLGEAKMVPSGVIRLIELQEKGYNYLRP